ncbi:MAG: nitroreductase family deazaflavin-dependent oxidoreductase [Acidimicrobiia bacterium]
MSEPARRIRPGWLLRKVANSMVRWSGAVPTLSVVGRRSGKPQLLPVNVLELGGERYLMSARGESEWVQNLRAAGGGEIRRRRKRQRFTATEVPAAERPPIIAAYRAKWDGEVKRFFEQLPDPAQHPVFKITDAS